MPVWAFAAAIAISFFYVIPAGMIQALTNTQIGLKCVLHIPDEFCLFPDTNLILSVITELIIGYCLPGRPVAMMLFKTWGYIVSFSKVACS